MPAKYWGAGSNGGSDGDWNNPSNWDGDTLPVDGDGIIFDGATTSSNLTIGPSSNITVVNFVIFNNFSGFVAFFDAGVTSGVIINGGFINDSVNTAGGNFSFLNCTSFSGSWSILLISRTGASSEHQYFSNPNIEFNSTNHIYAFSDQLLSISYRCSTSPSPENFTSFTINGVGISSYGVSSYYRPLDIESTTFNITNGTIELVPNNTHILKTNYLNISMSSGVVFSTSPGFNIPYSTNAESAAILPITGTSNLNISIQGGLTSRLLTPYSNLSGGGFGSILLSTANVSFSASNISYIQDGSFHLAMTEGRVQGGMNPTIQVIFSGVVSAIAKGTSTVSYDDIFSPSSSPTFTFLENSTYSGNTTASHTFYDESEVQSLRQTSYVYNSSTGGNDLYVYFIDAAAGGSYPLYYRYSKKTSF